MATRATQLPAYFAGNADFQAFVTGIHNALAALGMTQTADTGQITPASVALPAGGAVAGYEIWRFNDTLQATVPVFIKIEYGGGSPADRPGLYFTVGSGSNLSGTLTGQRGDRQFLTSSQSKGAGVTLPFYGCGDGSDLFLALNIDAGATTFGMFFALSRPRDENGTPTNEGVLTMMWNVNNGQGWCQWIPATGSVPGTLVGQSPFINPGFFNRSTGGENADVCPALMPLLGAWRYARLLACGQGDFGSGGTFQTILFGASHTFLALGYVLSTFDFMPAGNGPKPSWAIPWE